MGETLLETQLHRPGTSQALGCIASIPIILAVFVGVNLWIVLSGDRLPREIEGTTPYFVLATLITGAFAAWFWWRNRIRLTVVEREGVKYVEIYDPAAPIVLQEPIEVVYGWNSFHMPRAGTMTMLIVGLYQEGELRVSLTETWGSLYSPPHGWPSEFGLSGVAQASYTAAGKSFLPDLVNLLVD
ncbi:MAG: hypothetical protein H6737_28860 [Alphaproteobacteria bacterium]|nr:hypothetical protein [Alphaproteobacteria bacterium]